MRTGAVALIVLLLEASVGCASKKGGKAVLVVRDPDAVRGCSFLGRVTQTATESEPAGEGMLRQRTSEIGGDTLLIRGGGIGEAWDCGQKLRAYAPATLPTPTRPLIGAYPTAPATPRY